MVAVRWLPDSILTSFLGALRAQKLTFGSLSVAILLYVMLLYDMYVDKTYPCLLIWQEILHFLHKC